MPGPNEDPGGGSPIARLYRRTPLALRRFLVTGGLTVALDALVYSALLHLSLAADAAKGSSLVAATIFAYVVNRFWAFEGHAARGSRLIAFLTLYASAVALNVAVNHAVLALLHHVAFAYPAAWFCATAASSTLNYLGLRHFVFPSR